MRSIRLVGVLVAGALCVGASQAAAQGPPPLDGGYAHINIGAQTGSHDLTQQGSFPLYGEDALFNTTIDVGGSPIFDIGAGYRVIWSQFYVGLSLTRSSDRANSTVTGSIPHPLVTDQFRAVTGEATGLKHSETALHLQAVWRQPVTTKFDVALSVGPTIFFVNQDLVSGLTVAEQGNPTTGVVLTGVQTEKVSETGVGFNIGADGTYMITQRLGAGGFLRYTGGSVDLKGAAGTFNLDVGGLQVGAGLRVRF